MGPAAAPNDKINSSAATTSKRSRPSLGKDMGPPNGTGRNAALHSLLFVLTSILRICFCISAPWKRTVRTPSLNLAVLVWVSRMKCEPATIAGRRLQTPASTGDALPVATQNLLAVPRAIAIAPAHADIPTSEAAPAIDIHANPRAPITSEAVPASVDIHIDVGAATLPTTRSVFTRTHLSDRATSLAAASARPSILTLYAAGSLLLALLLHLLYETLGPGSGAARKECRCLLGAYAKGQHRCGGV